MFEKEIGIFKELFKINEEIGEEFKASSYREIYIKLQILKENKDFQKSYKEDLDFKFKNSLTNIQKLKFGKEKNLNLNEIFSEKTLNKIKEIQKRGKLKILEDLKKDKEIKYIRNLTKIFGVGPTTAKYLVDRGVKNFKDYKNFYKSRDLTKIQKIGIKYHNIQKIEKNSNVTKKVLNLIKTILKNDETIHLMGSGRVELEKSSDIDLVICNKNGDISKIIQFLEKKEILKDYSKSSENDIMGVIEIDKKFYRIDIKCTIRKYLATYLLYFGSGKYFSKFIRKIAKDKGYKLNQYGIEDLNNGKVHFFRFENGIFRFLNLPEILPIDRFTYW